MAVAAVVATKICLLNRRVAVMRYFHSTLDSGSFFPSLFGNYLPSVLSLCCYLSACLCFSEKGSYVYVCAIFVLIVYQRKEEFGSVRRKKLKALKYFFKLG